MLRTPEPPVIGQVGYPLGFAAAVVVSVVAVAAHATGHPLWSVGALTVTAAMTAAVTTLPATLATAGVCWMLHAGFVLGRRGELELSAESAADAALLTAATVLSYGTAVAVRIGRQRRAEIPEPRRPDSNLQVVEIFGDPLTERSSGSLPCPG